MINLILGRNSETSSSEMNLVNQEKKAPELLYLPFVHTLSEKDVHLPLVLGMYKKENGRNLNLANPLFVLASKYVWFYFFL